MNEEIARLRSAFPALEAGLCFLDWAATGIAPEPARRAVQAYLEGLAACADGRSTWMHADHAKTRARARSRIAGMLGAKPDDVALVESTTFGLEVAAQAIPLRAGDNVLLSSVDYLAVAHPWKRRARRDGIELRFLPHDEGAITPETLLAHVDARTRVIALATVGWTSGALLDVAAVAHEARLRGIHLVLDAVQSFGVVPLDLRATPASFVACGGHKWLASPLGAGFLCVSPHAAIRCPPALSGFLNGEPPRGTWAAWFLDPEASPEEEILMPASGRSFEVGGTPSYPGAIGIDEATQLFDGAGVGRIAGHVRDLGTALIEGLDRRNLPVRSPREPGRRAGIVVFGHPAGGAAELALVESLRRRGIVVSVRYCRGVGGVRVSLHGPNAREDVARLLAALEEVG